MTKLGALRAAGLAGLLATMLGAIPARAVSRGRTRVSLDWRNVSDADIERCGLSRLRAGTLEQLVEDGHAVVDSSDATIRVRVSSVAGGLHIRVESLLASREDTLGLPRDCDATLVLEAIARIGELVRRVSTESEPAAPAEPSSLPRDIAPEASAHLGENAGFQLSLDAAAKAANPSDFLLFGGGVGLDFGVLAHWQLGGRAELLGNARDGVTVLEASTALSAGWQPAGSPLGLQLECAPLLHIGASERMTATEADGTAGAGIKLRTGLFRAQLIGFVRLRRFEHFVDGKAIFDTGQAGLILRIGAQLFDS